MTVFNKSKGAVLTILKALNFDIWKDFTLEISKAPKNSKFKRSLTQ